MFKGFLKTPIFEIHLWVKISLLWNHCDHYTRMTFTETKYCYFEINVNRKTIKSYQKRDV